MKDTGGAAVEGAEEQLKYFGPNAKLMEAAEMGKELAEAADEASKDVAGDMKVDAAKSVYQYPDDDGAAMGGRGHPARPAGCDPQDHFNRQGVDHGEMGLGRQSAVFREPEE